MNIPEHLKVFHQTLQKHKKRSDRLALRLKRRSPEEKMKKINLPRNIPKNIIPSLGRFDATGKFYGFLSRYAVIVL